MKPFVAAVTGPRLDARSVEFASDALAHVKNHADIARVTQAAAGCKASGTQIVACAPHKGICAAQPIDHPIQ
jgi:hypothetical protein